MTRASEIKAALQADAVNFLTGGLLGNSTMTRGHDMRWGRKFSLSYDLRKHLFYDHEAGVGGDILDLIKHVKGYDTKQALEWGAAMAGLAVDNLRDAGRPVPNPVARPAQDKKSASSVDHFPTAMRAWSECRPLAGSPAETYLHSRGLSVPVYSDDFGFHPACIRGTERHPAMVARMRDPITGKPCGIHRTYLQPDGCAKADGAAKLMLGNAGVIHLSDPREVLHRIGICEGIETGFALIQRGGWEPIWAAGSAGGIARFPVLAYADLHITIFADNDDNGASLNAANECAKRWVDAGRNAYIKAPQPGCDWASVARGDSSHG